VISVSTMCSILAVHSNLLDRQPTSADGRPPSAICPTLQFPPHIVAMALGPSCCSLVLLDKQPIWVTVICCSLRSHPGPCILFLLLCIPPCGTNNPLCQSVVHASLLMGLQQPTSAISFPLSHPCRTLTLTFFPYCCLFCP
jgi:hypothetical protein